MVRALNYQPPSSQVRRLWPWLKALAIAVVALMLVSVIEGTEVRYECGWVCATCASRRTQTDWIFGFTTSRAFTPSALDRWLRDHQQEHAHDWRSVRCAGTTLSGRHMSSSCGFAPPILPLQFDLMEDYVKAALDDELREFVRIMMSGSEREQKEAVKAAAAKVLRHGLPEMPGS